MKPMIHKHHVIKFKDGKRIRTNTLVKYTIEEHAAEHKRLFKEGGHWKDELAYKGLSGLIGKEEMLREVFSHNGESRIGKKHKGDFSRFAHWTGKKMSVEHRKSISIAGMGRVQTERQKRITREVRQKAYTITDPKGNTYDIVNLLEFSKKHHLDQGNLCKVAQQKLKSHKGYKVEYRELPTMLSGEGSF
jgi:hypothetical protein